jgi:hypothetical protein
MTAYFHFMRDFKKKEAEKNSCIPTENAKPSPLKTFKELGQIWNEMTTDEKNVLT